MHPKAAALVRWFTQHGGQLSGHVHIAFSESRGFHVRATAPLSSAPVVTCPLKLSLSCLNLDPAQHHVTYIDSCLQPCQGKIPDHILTYLVLIEQRLKGQASPWHAYIACLPSPATMTTPLWFDEQDWAFLAGTSLAPAAKERRSDYFQQWQQAHALLQDAGLPWADQVDFETLLWAATIFTSRAFISTHIVPDHDTVPVLFPVIDLFNHSATAQVEWHFEPSTAFSLKLLQADAVKPGQEVFNNYAPKQNDELLLGYGFCLEENPIDQFPLKLAFSPILHQYAHAARLFQPEHVPFGMQTDFLNQDPDTQQHFLRAKGHPFGRYHNCIPFFRGIPAYIVHFFFIQTLLSLDLDVAHVKVEKPGVGITLHVLVLLHQAITQRSQTLPLSLAREPLNDKQKYAKIYRDGQANIIHSIRLELQAAIERIRAPTEHISSRRGALLTTAEAIQELPNLQSQRFNAGLTKHELHDAADEPLVWTLFLVCIAAHSLTSSSDASYNRWLPRLCARYPLPSLEDGIQDADTYTFVDENLGDFLGLPHHDDTIDTMQQLDAIVPRSTTGHHQPALMHGKTDDNLGARLVMWAMTVAERQVFPVLLDGVMRKCMFVQPWHKDIGDDDDDDDADDDDGDAWLYEE
ncbi:hypothetical protein ACEQ8H_003519 [Pleosporales sp. CAS-2024a]